VKPVLRILRQSVGVPTRAGSTRAERAHLRLRELASRLFDKIGVPGFVRDAKITDELTGHSINIRARGLFTKITVNGRDYYFHRLTGRFDGTGTGCG